MSEIYEKYDVDKLLEANGFKRNSKAAEVARILLNGEWIGRKDAAEQLGCSRSVISRVVPRIQQMPGFAIVNDVEESTRQGMFRVVMTSGGKENDEFYRRDERVATFNASPGKALEVNVLDVRDTHGGRTEVTLTIEGVGQLTGYVVSGTKMPDDRFAYRSPKLLGLVMLTGGVFNVRIGSREHRKDVVEIGGLKLGIT